MSCSKITLIGLYNYDPTIFDNLLFPAGIVKDIAINEILVKSGEFEVVYPDPEFLKSMIEHWGKKTYRTFEKWIEALSIEFNPLYNFDRYEEYSDTRAREDERSRADIRNRKDERSHEDERNRADSRQRNDTNTRSDSKESVDNASSVSATDTTTKNDTTTTRSVSAYDSATYQPREQEVVDNDVKVEGTGNAVSTNQSKESGSANETQSGNEIGNESEKTKASESGSETESGNATESGKENELSQHSGHLYGNIGVTTSTQLLEDFLRVERFNIYEQIADIFISEFCILVYE